MILSGWRDGVTVGRVSLESLVGPSLVGRGMQFGNALYGIRGMGEDCEKTPFFAKTRKNMAQKEFVSP